MKGGTMGQMSYFAFIFIHVVFEFGTILRIRTIKNVYYSYFEYFIMEPYVRRGEVRKHSINYSRKTHMNHFLIRY